MRRIDMLACLVMGLVLVARSAHGVPVDGTLDPEYGSALSTQTTQTSLGDQPGNALNGSELDEAYGFVSGDTLHVFIAGSFNRYFGEPLIEPNYLQLFIDDETGGQNALSGSNPSVGNYVNLQSMSALQFDPEFAPDYWVEAALERSGPSPFVAYYAELPSGGGGAGYFLGATTIGGPGTLSGPGSNNPYGVLTSIDVTNTGGVTAGCDAASGAGVITGIEWAIPFAAIGNPTGSIKACVMLVKPGVGSTVSNQILGPVPPGTCSLGAPGTVDFGAIAGLQFFIIDAATPVVRTTWGRLKAAYR